MLYISGTMSTDTIEITKPEVTEPFLSELEHLINRFSEESGSDTPDFILASYLYGCLVNYNRSLQARENWYGREIHQKSSNGIPAVPTATP